MSLRIGILLADHVREAYRARHGDYPDMFERVLSQARQQRHGHVEFAVYDVEAGHYPEALDACDGYVITGSRRSVYDDLDWIRELGRFVVRLHEARVPTIGICFGHQLIAHVLGGETRAADVGWGVGVHVSQVLERESWMAAPATEFALLCSHQDQVVKLPTGARLLATSDFCPISAFALGDHFVTFQGHPEFRAEYSRELMQSRRDLLGDALEPGLASLERAHDADRVATWMLDFILQRRPTSA